MNNVSTTKTAKLTTLEETALRGLDAEQRLLQIQVEEAIAKLNERRALVYVEIESRLELPTGSLLSGKAKVEGDSVSWAGKGKKAK